MNLVYFEIGGRASYRKLLLSEIIRTLTGFEPKSTSTTARVQALYNEIESSLHQPWTVAGMAERVFISEEQLNRVTKTLFNLSPRSKLIQLRMDKATSLLKYQDWSVSMIANRLGYKDPYNFSHRFKSISVCHPVNIERAIDFLVSLTCFLDQLRKIKLFSNITVLSYLSI